MEDETEATLVGDTGGPEYIVRYNLFDASESVGGLFTLQTGHANITLIERDGVDDTIVGGGNLAVNAGGPGAVGDRDSLANPWDDKLDGILGVDSPSWQGVGTAIYEQTVTAEQFQAVQDHITSYTGDLDSTINVNYNVGASVFGLEDQHSCFTFVRDIYEATGAEGNLMEQFSASELAKVDNLIETVHGDIPAIPGKAADKIRDALDSASDSVENGVDKVRNATGFGSEAPETETLNRVAPAFETAKEASLSTESDVSLYEAVETLSRDYAEIENAYEGGAKSPVHQALSHPSTSAMFENLNNNGVDSIKADISETLSSEERAGNILLGGKSATQEAGLPMPEEQQDVAAQAGHDNASIPPPAQIEQVHEDEHSFSL